MPKGAIFPVVFTDADGLSRRVGDLACSRKAGDEFKSQFRYANDWPFSLSRELPLAPKTSVVFHGLPNLFEDILPDAWGRALIARAYGIPSSKADSLSLLEGISKGGFDLIGAISFSSSKTNRSNGDLNDLVRNVIDVEEGSKKDIETLIALARLTGSGGARPKFMHSDAGEWIVKPSSKEDCFDIVRGEHVCLRIADKIGIGAPETKVVVTQRNGRDVASIMVERFDVTLKGRNHVVPMKTFLGAKSSTAGSYEEIFEIIRRISNDPAADTRRLFQQMLLNILVGNIDDHLKNFSMIGAAMGGTISWRLSPAYDITPAAMENQGAASFHSIEFIRGDGGAIPAWSTVVQLAGLAGISAQKALSMFDEIQSELGELAKKAIDTGMSDIMAEAWASFAKDRMESLQPKKYAERLVAKNRQ